MSSPRILIFGAGWIGIKFKNFLGERAVLSRADITDKHAVAEALDKVKPHAVINTAGKKGKPNIDWCEDHKRETVASNITGPLVVADECMRRGIFMAHLSSGCIFTGASPTPGGFTEEDTPNPVSFYSWSKAQADEVLRQFPVLILRLRMPVTAEPSQGNLITKLVHYEKVINVENSLTVVDDLLAATLALIEKGKTGIYNIANPGPVAHGRILDLYKEMVDPAFTYELIPVDELYSRGLAKAERSNCILNTAKLAQAGIVLPPAEERIKDCLREYRTSM